MGKITNQYNNRITPGSVAVSGAKGFFALLWKTISTVLMVLLISGSIVAVAMCIYLYSLASQPTGINLASEKLQQTSFLYIYNDDNKPVEYQRLHGSENRVWVSLDKIPKAMADAQIAIEDKRYYEHSGVDWVRTAGAIINLGSESSYGGSTITQQLIKNITGDNEVSITRKLTEIFKALNLEKEYTKDEILEAYLNIVNYGSGCQGVQAAANLYFAKDINECSVAECAAIAGITQNPAAYNPLIYPEDNKERRDTVIEAMYDQGMLTKDEYDQAKKESESLKFVGYENNKKEQENEAKKEKYGDDYLSNWYVEAALRDLQDELTKELNISSETASNKIYSGGLKIYLAMDLEFQQYCEKYIQDMSTPYDPNCELAVVMTDLQGRVLATVGGREKKSQMLVWDRANVAELQPGSSIKPLIVYPLAIEKNKYNYSSMVKDQPIDDWRQDSYGNWISGPDNVYGSYLGEITLPDAIERSSNATAAQTMELVGPKNAYNQAINKMYFRHLSTEDANNLGALSLGGLNGGVTVREMATAYQYMGNGGKVYDSYTYYYVEDASGNVIIDHRDQIPIQAYSSQTATIMNRELNYNVVHNNPAHTSAGEAKIYGWDILGKTGTTDGGKDHWFCGLSPYATCAVWTGYDTPSSLSQSSFSVAVNIFHDLMEKYLSDKKSKEYTLDETLEKHEYCASTGLLAGSYCSATFTGYYKKDHVPEYCSGYHTNYNYSGYSSESYNNYSNSYSDYNDDDDYSSDSSSSDDSSDDYSSEDTSDDYTSDSDTSGGDTSDGDTSGGDTSGGDTSGGDTSGGDTSGGDTSGGDTSGGDTSGGDTSGGDTSGGDTAVVVQ